MQPAASLLSLVLCAWGTFSLAPRRLAGRLPAAPCSAWAGGQGVHSAARCRVPAAGRGRGERLGPGLTVRVSPRGDALLTEMERGAGQRFMERQNIKPLRLVSGPGHGRRSGRAALTTRVRGSAAGQQVGPGPGWVGSGRAGPGWLEPGAQSLVAPATPSPREPRAVRRAGPPAPGLSGPGCSRSAARWGRHGRRGTSRARGLPATPPWLQRGPGDPGCRAPCARRSAPSASSASLGIHLL